MMSVAAAHRIAAFFLIWWSQRIPLLAVCSTATAPVTIQATTYRNTRMSIRSLKKSDANKHSKNRFFSNSNSVPRLENFLRESKKDPRQQHDSFYFAVDILGRHGLKTRLFDQKSYKKERQRLVGKGKGSKSSRSRSSKSSKSKSGKGNGSGKAKGKGRMKSAKTRSKSSKSKQPSKRSSSTSKKSKSKSSKMAKLPSRVPVAPTTRPPTMTKTQEPTRSPSSNFVPVPTLSPVMDPVTGPPTVSPASDPRTGVPTISPASGATLSPIGSPTTSPADAPGSPTISPTPRDPNAPTRAPSDGIMFDVVFKIPSGTATDADLSAAGDVTVQYLQDFLTAQFDFNAVTHLESVEGMVVGTSSADTSAMLEISLIFSNDSQILPSMDDISSLLFTAFQQPFVNGLITMLGTELPPSNPLSGSTQVQAVLP